MSFTSDWGGTQAVLRTIKYPRVIYDTYLITPRLEPFSIKVHREGTTVICSSSLSTWV